MRTRMLLVAAVLLVLAGPSFAQMTKITGYNERDIAPQPHAFDRPDNWTLHFRFKDPRVILCDVPGSDRKRIVWYMLYQVYNLPVLQDGKEVGEPRYFVPDIELKTHDYESVHPDEVQPSVQKFISAIEDPTGKLGIKNSVEIFKEPIPLSKKDAYPRVVHGVAIWTDVYDRAPKTNRFSIFIAGLSDAWRKDPKSEIIRRKTLQINFNRLGDDIQNDANAIRWVDNPQWMYRATELDLTGKKVILERVPEEALLPKGKDRLPPLLPVALPTPRESAVLPPKP